MCVHIMLVAQDVCKICYDKGIDVAIGGPEANPRCGKAELHVIPFFKVLQFDVIANLW